MCVYRRTRSGILVASLSVNCIYGVVGADHDVPLSVVLSCA